MQKDDTSSSGCRAAKRTRIGIHGGDDDPPLDLLSLYQSDIGDRILSYASSVDLCTLDKLSKQFKILTTNQWKVVTKERFGMNNGKDGWRVGISFLRPPLLANMSDENIYRKRGKRVATNESYVMTVGHYIRGIEVFDTSELRYIQNLTTSIGHNWTITICGRIGSEIIVTSNGEYVCAQRGNEVQRWSHNTQALNGLKSIGCETHLIIPYDDRIQIYEVNHEVGLGNSSTELLSLRKDIRVEEGRRKLNGRREVNVAWGPPPDKTHFIIGYPHQICVWKFDAATHSISLMNTITVNEFEVRGVALAEDYIAASVIGNYYTGRKAHIWNRKTGEKMVYADEDSLYEDHLSIYRPCLFCYGHILVSTSKRKSILCVWNMKTGRLIQRYDILPRDEYGRPQSVENSDAVYLDHFNAFLCLTSSLGLTDEMIVLVSFPSNKRQSDMATTIIRRETRSSESDIPIEQSNKV